MTTAIPLEAHGPDETSGAPVDLPKDDLPKEERAAKAAHLLAARVARGAHVHAVDWERLWLATQRAPWATLALVPIGEDLSTRRIATVLAEVGRQHLGGTIVALDATNVSLSTLQTRLSELSERARCAERAIVALPPLSGSPAGLAVARAADAVLLCIELDSSEIADAAQVLADLGRDCVLGSVIVQKRKES